MKKKRISGYGHMGSLFTFYFLFLWVTTHINISLSKLGIGAPFAVTKLAELRKIESKTLRLNI